MKPGEPPRAIVTVADVDDVLREIGPVDAGAPGWGSALPSGAPRSGSAPRRLYRVHEGAMIAGLCNGIAAHFNTDPTLVRIAFVTAGIVEIAAFDRPPAGVAGLYAILVFIVPYAASAPEGAEGRLDRSWTRCGSRSNEYGGQCSAAFATMPALAEARRATYELTCFDSVPISLLASTKRIN